ncbi:MAG: antibiotic biosynthesis monooxygenase [Gaiellaceae bacterium]
MHARVARYAIEPDRLDDALDGLRDAGRELAELEGYKGGHVLVDYDDGTLITLTLWENRAAIDRSDVRAAQLRQRAMRTVEGEVQSVTCYQVPFELG